MSACTPLEQASAASAHPHAMAFLFFFINLPVSSSEKKRIAAEHGSDAHCVTMYRTSFFFGWVGKLPHFFLSSRAYALVTRMTTYQRTRTDVRGNSRILASGGESGATRSDGRPSRPSTRERYGKSISAPK